VHVQVRKVGHAEVQMRQTVVMMPVLVILLVFCSSVSDVACVFVRQPIGQMRMKPFLQQL
jgi:hypothetical protein